MSIRPVDYQILMPKVNEVGQAQNAAQLKSLSHVMQQAEHSVKQAEHDTDSVHSQSEAQKVVITEKQKDKNSRNRQNGKSGNENGDDGQSENSGGSRKQDNNRGLESRAEQTGGRLRPGEKHVDIRI